MWPQAGHMAPLDPLCFGCWEVATPNVLALDAG